MSDPSALDPVTIGGSALGGSALVGLLVRTFLGDLKEKIADLKSDTREQLTSIKDMIARGEDRHDKAIAELAVLQRDVGSVHHRIDQLDARLEDLERDRRRG